MSRVNKSIETESTLMVSRAWKKEGIGSNYFMDMWFSFGVMRMFWNKVQLVVVQHCEYARGLLYHTF